MSVNTRSIDRSARQLCAAMPMPAIFLRQGRIEALNAAGMRAFGRVKALVGQAAAEISPELALFLRDSRAANGWREPSRLNLPMLVSKRVVEAQLLPLDSGPEDWLLLCGRPGRSHAEGRQTDDLYAADRLLRLTTDAVIATDGGGNISLFNGGAQSIFGYDLQEILGRPFDILIPPRFRKAHARHGALSQARRCATRMMEKRSRIVGLRKDGQEFPAEASIARLPGTDRSGAIIVLRDVSDRVALENDLREAESQLERAKHAAEAAGRAKSEFLNLMSHELRTPLNAVIGFSGLIADEACGPIGNGKYREYAQDIVASGRHLLDLINRILNLARFEAGKLELQESDVELDEVVEHCLSMLSNEAHRAGLTLEPGQVHKVTLAADRFMLCEVVLNLLSNAIKFTDAGGLVTVDVTRERSTGWVMIRVADTGLGIAEKDIPRALEPFGQVATTSARTLGGSGLGLPLAKACVELHGGTLSITSTPGKGTTVTVGLPPSRILGVDEGRHSNACADLQSDVGAPRPTGNLCQLKGYENG